MHSRRARVGARANAGVLYMHSRRASPGARADAGGTHGGQAAHACFMWLLRATAMPADKLRFSATHAGRMRLLGARRSP